MSPNAVIVNSATTTALTKAVLYLHAHPGIRHEIGRAGRDTVVKFFSLGRQIQSYSDLYKLLFYSRIHTSDNKLLVDVVTQQFQREQREQQQQQQDS